MSVSVGGFISAFKSVVAAHFSERVEVVGDYHAFADGVINTPAILLDVEGISDGDDLGDGRTPLQLTCSAYCLLGLATEDVQLEVRQFASELLVFLRHNRFGLAADVTNPEGLSARAGPFQRGKEGYDSFEVTWQQVVYVGTDVWADGGATPVAYIHQAPEIGAAHEQGYDRVVPE